MNLKSYLYSDKILFECEFNIKILILNNEYQKKNIFLVLNSFYLSRNFYGSILLFLYSTYGKTEYL